MRAWFPALLVATALTVTACDQQPTAPNGPLQLSVVSGDEQNGEPGAELADPLVVQVEDSRGHTISGQIVNFRVVEGGGSVFAGVAITNKVGIAQERWTLGLSGPQTVEARAVDPDTGAPLTFAVFTATLVDNQPPEVSDVVATPNPAQTTDPVTLSAHVADASNITGAEYSINGGEYLPMAAADGSFDSPSEDVQANLGPPGSAGDRNLCVRATDARGNTSGDVCVMITVNAPPQEIFVAIGSGNDSNPGTMQAPKATIGAGIEAAVAQGYSRVNIAQGNYSEKVTLHTGIGLYGGYEASGWTRNAAVHITTIGGTTAGQPAVIGTSVSNVTLDGLVVSGPAATASAPNSYGLLLRNATNITINGSRIIASDGFGGSPGYVGSNGVSGGSGGNGVPGDPDGIAGQGGTAGVGYCVNSNGGHGGAGGPEGANSGQAGENGHGSSPGLGGIGGAGGDPGSAGSNGGNGGSVGVLGSPGVGGLAFGSLTTGGLYQPALGGTASNGSPGSGGGGGGGGGGQGGLFLNDGGGNGGGGGGGGGCGGTGGTGGSGGGGSFALVLYQSSGIAITGSEITAGNGGLGGSGGVGGKGGAGGPGGAGPKLHSDEIGAGGDGGHGGYGGDGGIGGGGGGGPSIGILRVGPDAPSIPDLGAGTTISVGAGGYGGGGGSTGATGLAEQIHVIS